MPRVYLVPRAGDLSAGGALIAGRDVQLNLSGDVLNTGSIAGRELVQIGAQNLTNTGLITGHRASISARDDVNNIGGTITTTDAFVLQAGRDLNAQTTTAQGSGAAGVGRYGSEQVNRVAGLYVSNEAGVLLASAGREPRLILIPTAPRAAASICPATWPGKADTARPRTGSRPTSWSTEKGETASRSTP